MTEYASAVDTVLASGGNPNGAQDTSAPAPQPFKVPNLASPYGRAVDRVVADDNARLQQSLNAAFRQNPEIAAKVKEAAAQIGMPNGAAQRNPDEVQRLAQIQVANDLLGQSKTLSGPFRDPAFSALASDDIATLTETEKRMLEYGSIAPIKPLDATEYTPSLLREFPRSLQEFQQRAIGMVADLRSWTLEKLGVRPIETDIYGNEIPAGTTQSLARRTLRALGFERELDTPRFSNDFYGKTAGAIHSGLQSTIQNAPGTLASLLTGNPIPGLAFAGVQSGGDQWFKTRERGGTAGEALLAGGATGAVEVATELLPMQFLVDALGASGAKSFIIRMGASVLTDVPGEQIATLAQDAIDTAIANPGMTWSQYLAQRPDAAYQTLVATVTQGMVTGGVLGAGKMLLDRQRAGKDGEAQTKALKSLLDTAAASKLRERDPGAFAQTVQGMAAAAGTPEVFIEAEAFAQSLQAAGDDASAILARMPSVAPQMAEATISGGDVRVPVGELVAAVAGTPLADSLLQHVRTNPEALSPAQAKALSEADTGDLHAAAEKIIAEHEFDAQWQASVDRVYQRVLDDLTTANRFTGDVNKAYATLVRDFFAVNASKMGVAPADLYAQFPLRVVAQSPAAGGDGQLDQAAPETQTPEFKRWFGESKVVDEGGAPRVVYHGTNKTFSTFSRAKSIGGMYWFTSDKSAIERGEVGARGRGKIVDVYLSLQNPAGWAEYDKFGTDELIARGYDGLALPDKSGEAVYVAFEPTQIKSASRNRGTFDPNDANILRQDAQKVGDRWRNRIATLTAGSVPPSHDFGLGRTPDAFRALGWSDRGVSMLAGKIAKAMREHPEVPRDVWERLPELLADPVAVLPSGYSDGSVLAVLDAVDTNGKPIVAAVLPEGRNSNGQTNHFVLSVYGKDDGVAWLESRITEALKRGGSVYVRDEGPAGAKDEPGTGKAGPAHPVQIRVARPVGAKGKVVSGPPKVKADDSLPQGVRGTFTPSTNTIALLKDADLSTFLHETGHFFLEVYADLASRPDAPAQVAADMQALVKWFGVKDVKTIEDWRKLTLAQQRGAHEKFARGFEAYLFKGEAPNVEIQGLFQRFRAWLVSVYRSIKALDVSLTDEVRGVMDRMLATDLQIKVAEQTRAYRPLFETAEQIGMTPEEWTAYQDLANDATTTAVENLERRSLRDMKWLADAKARVIRGLQRDTRAKRQAVKAEVEAEVRRIPIYAAQRFLSHGEIAESDALNKGQRRALEEAGQVGTKLSLPALQAMYGEGPAAPWRYLATGKRGLAAKQGLHPDTVAELFGFTSGDELVRKILEAEPMAPLVEARTDQRMLERYGDLSDPAEIERAAEAAIHNEARARFLAAELKALGEANKVREPAGTSRSGKPLSINLMVKAAKQYAVEIIGRQKVKDVRPAKYAAAEARNARTAAEAFASGKTTDAAAAKRQQLLSHHTAAEALRVQAEIDRGVTYLRKFDKESVRKSVDPDYVDQIDALLERYDLRRGTSLKAIAKRASLIEWIEAQRAQGIEPPIDPDIVKDARRQSYKELTVEEFRGLVDSVKVIEHLGRLKQQLLTAKDKREFEVIRQEIVASIEDNTPGEPRKLRTRNTFGAKAAELWRGFLAMHRKAASIAYEMDGFKDGGPLWEYVIRPMNEAGAREASMREKATIDLARITEPLTRGGKMGGKGTYFPAIGESLNREERITIALNLGNAGNTQRLLDGGIGDSGPLQPQQLQPILDTLTEEEWQVVQAVWDYFETYRPQIAAKERRVNGIEPEWVEPTPVDTKFGTLRGGYYPIKYDPKASKRAQEHADAEAARQQMQAAYTSATTRRSFVKSRAEAVKGRPLLLNFSAVYQGLNEIIHDLSWHEWLIDANRILKSEGIDKAMRRGYGPEVVRALTDAVKDIATGDVGPQNAFERSINHIRTGATVAGLGWNVMTSLLQPLGLTQSMVRIGPDWVAKGFAGWAKHGPQFVYDRSEFMRLRAKTMQREINEVAGQISGGKSKLRSNVEVSFFYLIQKAQLVADMPTWLGRYEKAIAAGEAEERAAELADQAVIDSQGGGQIKDLSAIQRGGPLLKLFTNFYSFFNVAYNLGVERTKATIANPTPANLARLPVDYLLLYVAPAVLGQMLKDALIGGDDDEDAESYAKKLAQAQLSYLLGLMVGLRELGAAASGFAGYQGPAGTRFYSELGKFAQQAGQGDIDGALLKALNNVTGILLHYPSGQINKTVDGAVAIVEGRTANPAALVTGAPRK